MMRPKIWIRMLYFSHFKMKKIIKQFEKLGIYKDPQPLNKMWVNIWNNKMGSLTKPSKEGPEDILLQKAIDKLARGEITEMDW